MTPAEIVKALRCTATVQTGDEPCASCPFNRTETLTEEQKAQLHCEEWHSCDVDGVALAAADLIERLEKEKAALMEAANPRKLCDICKHDSWCADHCEHPRVGEIKDKHGWQVYPFVGFGDMSVESPLVLKTRKKWCPLEARKDETS